MFDHWDFHEWMTFGLCVILGLAWLLYAYAVWQSNQPRTNFDRRHDEDEES